MPYMKLTDVKTTDQMSRHEIDGREIGGQDIYRLEIKNKEYNKFHRSVGLFAHKRNMKQCGKLFILHFTCACLRSVPRSHRPYNK